MAARDYSDTLRDEFGAIIDGLDLDDQRRRVLRLRWLDQLVWLERKAAEAQRRYYRLRVVTVVGAVIVPALVSAQAIDGTVGGVAQAAAIVVSLIVAVCAALEQFFHFGERWQHYRATAERVKSEGWLYFQRAGAYGRDGATAADLFPSFATRLEEILQAEVGLYLTDVTAERQNEGGVKR